MTWRDGAAILVAVLAVSAPVVGAMFAWAKYRERQRVSRRKAVRIAGLLLPTVKDGAVRPGGDQVKALRQTQRLWSELEDASSRAGGEIDRVAHKVIASLRKWKEQDWLHTVMLGELVQEP